MRASSVLRASALLFLLAVGLGAFAFPPQAQAAGGIQGDCILSVPASPLTAQGLATPWFLSDGLSACRENNPATAVFVQATIFDPATDKFAVYSPIVEDFGGYPLIMPTAPSLRTGDVVGIWGGGDDTTTHLTGPGASSCVNGLSAGSPFGQVFFCGAAQFFSAVNAAGARVTVPPLGQAQDGFPCPTVRDFSVVDQDQSDNVQTQYLVSANGNTAQDTAANRAYLAQQGITTTIATNPSDNRVLTNGMDPALGCTPWMAPDLADNGNLVPSQALDELQAAHYQSDPALIPLNDPMTLDNGTPSLAKTNLYRAGVDQPQAGDASTATYCIHVLIHAPAKLLLDEPLFIHQPSPVPAIGNNLFTFLAARLKTTLGPAAGGGLGCTDILHITNPVTTQTNGSGVTEFAQIIPPNTGQQLFVQRTPTPPHQAQPQAAAGEGFQVDPIYLILAAMVVVLVALGGVGFAMYKMHQKLTSIDRRLGEQNGIMKLNAPAPPAPQVDVAEQTLRELQNMSSSDPMELAQKLARAAGALQSHYGGTVAVSRPPTGRSGAGMYEPLY